jgi:hypothetical protein
VKEGEGGVVPPPGAEIEVKECGGGVGGVGPPPGAEIEVKEGSSLLLALKSR